MSRKKCIQFEYYALLFVNTDVEYDVVVHTASKGISFVLIQETALFKNEQHK